MLKLLYFLCLTLFFVGCINATEGGVQHSSLTASKDVAVEKVEPASIEEDAAVEKVEPSRSRNLLWQEDEYIVVCVVIDVKAEQLREGQVESTGMLRTASRLRKEYPNLPKRYKISSRLKSRKLYRKEGLYKVETMFKLADILCACEQGAKN